MLGLEIVNIEKDLCWQMKIQCHCQMDPAYVSRQIREGLPWYKKKYRHVA